MTEWRSIDQASLRDLLDRLYGLSWRWRVDEVPEVLDRLGWKVNASTEHGVTADTGDGFGGDEATILYNPDGTVDRINVQVSDRAARRTPEGLQRITDAFTDVVGAITAQRGEPTATEPGPQPSAGWRDDRYTLTALGGGSAVLLNFTPTARPAPAGR